MDADDPLYDELYDNYSGLIRGFTSQIADIDRQMDDVRANIDTNGARRESVDRLKDTISEMWNHIDELPDDKVKAFMKSFIAEIHVTEEPDVIQGNNYWVKRIRFKVPIRVSKRRRVIHLMLITLSNPMMNTLRRYVYCPNFLKPRITSV